MELSEGVKPTTVKEGVFRRIRRKAEAAVRGFDPRAPEVEFTSVSPQSMAGIILNQIGNPVREKFGANRWANPFTVEDVFANVKVIPDEQYPTSKNPDVVKKRIEDALVQLVNLQVMAHVGDQESKSGRALSLYKVVNEQRLRDIAEKRLVPNPEPAHSSPTRKQIGEG